jgi:hypothetical protein
MQSLQDAGEPTARCHPPTTRHAALEAKALLKCGHGERAGAPPVHMIKLTETRGITPYKWDTRMRRGRLWRMVGMRHSEFTTDQM